MGTKIEKTKISKEPLTKINFKRTILRYFSVKMKIFGHFLGGVLIIEDSINNHNKTIFFLKTSIKIHKTT